MSISQQCQVSFPHCTRKSFSSFELYTNTDCVFDYHEWAEGIDWISLSQFAFLKTDYDAAMCVNTILLLSCIFFLHICLSNSYCAFHTYPGKLVMKQFLLSGGQDRRHERESKNYQISRDSRKWWICSLMNPGVFTSECVAAANTAQVQRCSLFCRSPSSSYSCSQLLIG